MRTGVETYLLAIRVHVQLGNDNLGWVQTKVHGRSVVLLPVDTLDLDLVLLPVHAGNLSVTVLEGATHNNHFVVFTDGQRAHLQQKQDMNGL